MPNANSPVLTLIVSSQDTTRSIHVAYKNIFPMISDSWQCIIARKRVPLKIFFFVHHTSRKSYILHGKRTRTNTLNTCNVPTKIYLESWWTWYPMVARFLTSPRHHEIWWWHPRGAAPRYFENLGEYHHNFAFFDFENIRTSSSLQVLEILHPDLSPVCLHKSIDIDVYDWLRTLAIHLRNNNSAQIIIARPYL